MPAFSPLATNHSPRAELARTTLCNSPTEWMIATAEARHRRNSLRNS
jgi:hypothetical protein